MDNDYLNESTQYSLAKRVPSMLRGFVIQTSFGEIEIDSEEAEPIVSAVKAVLEKRLERQS